MVKTMTIMQVIYSSITSILFFSVLFYTYRACDELLQPPSAVHLQATVAMRKAGTPLTMLNTKPRVEDLLGVVVIVIVDPPRSGAAVAPEEFASKPTTDLVKLYKLRDEGRCWICC